VTTEEVILASNVNVTRNVKLIGIRGERVLLVSGFCPIIHQEDMRVTT
jgi:hypothetical protein